MCYQMPRHAAQWVTVCELCVATVVGVASGCDCGFRSELCEVLLWGVCCAGTVHGCDRGVFAASKSAGAALNVASLDGTKPLIGA